MGWDVTYHPIAADEVESIYFRGMKEPEHFQALARQFGVHEFYVEQMRLRFEEARGIDDEVPFNKGHAYYVAIISGFLRKYHYIRGGAFSFLLNDPAFAGYISDWKTLVPSRYQHLRFDNCLTENYCAGVFISNANLKRLRSNYASNPSVQAALDKVFSHGRLEVFWKAVDDAIANDLCLLEASEVTEPNPLDLNKSRCRSNLFNCYPDGALLYTEAVGQQLAEARIKSKNNTPPAPDDPPPKKGLFARLLGK